MRLKLLALLCAVFVVYSCNESLVTDNLEDDSTELKSASVEKKSYIVVLNDTELDAELVKLKGYEKKQVAVKAKTNKILKRAGITDGEIGHVYGTAIKGFSVKIVPGQLKKLQDDPAVKYIQPDRVISLELPQITIKKKPTPTPPDQSTPWGISRVNGGSTYTGNNVAWIVDTGIDSDHPDLNVNTALSKDFTGSGSAEDANGHGTHVSGTIAAINNDVGVIGVAAGATVISCRVLDSSGSGYFSWTVAALDYIAEAGSAGDVVNMSLGPSERYTDDAVDAAVQAVAAEGIKLSIAAGNESDDCSYYSPAHNDGTNIYTISACDSDDEWAYFSNYGDPVDFCEPGYGIYSTYMNGGYETLSGTSMAAPHAAGILLLGSISSDGTVSGDPYAPADPIGVVGGDVNHAPVADAGGDLSVTDIEGDGELVTFDGSDSYDIDGDNITYLWKIDGVEASTEKTFDQTLSIGEYSVSLTVSDDEYSSTDEITVTVSDGTSGGDITLISATPSKIRGVRYVELKWEGGGSPILIKMNGVEFSGDYDNDNDGVEKLNLGRISGTFSFEVCETDGSGCSNAIPVIF